MTDKDKMREEFEADYKNRRRYSNLSRKMEDGTYWDGQVRNSWESYQAACAHKDAEHAAEITALKTMTNEELIALAEECGAAYGTDDNDTLGSEAIVMTIEELAEYSNRLTAKQQEQIGMDTECIERIRTKSLQLEEQLAAAQLTVERMRGAVQYAIDDLIARAKLSEDDSLNISQGVLDGLHDCLKPSDTSALEAVREEAVVQARAEELERLGKLIHYPECWDTACYETLESALAEIGCSEHRVERGRREAVPIAKNPTNDSTRQP